MVRRLWLWLWEQWLRLLVQTMRVRRSLRRLLALARTNRPLGLDSLLVSDQRDRLLVLKWSFLQALGRRVHLLALRSPLASARTGHLQVSRRPEYQIWHRTGKTMMLGLQTKELHWAQELLEE